MHPENIEEFIDSAQYTERFELNLSKDINAREYWFTSIKKLVDTFYNQALKSQQHSSDAVVRCNQYRDEYKNILQIQQQQNHSYLSVRLLLEINEQLLTKFGFEDVWKEQKYMENTRALAQFKNRIDFLDKLSNEEKWIQLFRGILAGNIFDSGAAAVQEIIDDNFGLKDALMKIQKRPYLFDDIEIFMKRLEGDPHVCAALFADNSGFDIVLGVLPFVRELLLRKSKVILVANSRPSLNDVTYVELLELIVDASKHCEIIDKAYKNGSLLIRENGQSGVCLNFLTLSKELCECMILNGTDLIIIEGMGRALHTNLNVKFKCESLKLAVIKNEWFAKRLGGNLFDAIVKYETVP
ncbi:unnamed protein product [Diamesa hyperborea]